MRREWEVNKGAIQALAATWFAVGFVAFVFVALLWRDHDRQGHDTGAAWVHSPAHWVLPVWLGPFALVACIYVAIGIGLGVAHLWHDPPIRRVTRPVTEDLREVNTDA